MRNILIPMSGRGQRFKDAGYRLPKPLIEIAPNQPMIKAVVENIGIEGKYIFLALKDQCEDFDLKTLLPSFCQPNKCEIVVVEQITEGAACTCLLAKDQINNDEELIIANSDQLIEWSSKAFFDKMTSCNADGGILTFTATEHKWSFAKIVDGRVIEVAEKKPISNQATVGIYWFKRGRDFVDGTEQMIAKNIRTNNEFYVCPVFNELIANGKWICDFPVEKMNGIGTPEDLERYLNAQH
jgi:NDP-sugar pyrophosphorylase family protein